MDFFIDTADTQAIRELADTGLIDGVTTNPTLVMQAGKSHHALIAEICDIVEDLPVSAEVVATERDNMVREGEELANIKDNVVVKVPLTWDGLQACHHLQRNGIKVNVTLCFSANQALLAAKAGATYISPFIGRLDDIGFDGMDLISNIRDVYNNYGFETKLLAASIRSPSHVTQCALVGADVATVPPAVIKKLSLHPLTDIGLKSFLKDAAQSKG